MQNKNKRNRFDIHKKNLAKGYGNTFSCSYGECRSMAAHAENFCCLDKDEIPERSLLNEKKGFKEKSKRKSKRNYCSNLNVKGITDDKKFWKTINP